MWGALKGAVMVAFTFPTTRKTSQVTRQQRKRELRPSTTPRHKARIFGEHVKECMEMLQEEDPTKYEAHFAKFIEAGIDADKMEDMYSEAHGKIKENPDFEPSEKKGTTWERKGNTVTGDGTDVTRSVKLSLKQRKEKVRQKIAAAQAKMMD